MSDKQAESCRKYSRKKPCKECPFSRAIEPGATGGADPSVYVGQAYGPFWLPCHMDKDYTHATANQKANVLAQCAGAAIFRANVGVEDQMPPWVHQLPADTTLSFASPAELIAHHGKMSLEEAEEFLRAFPPFLLLLIELSKLDERHLNFVSQDTATRQETAA
jgi:hypothetical protein